MKVLNNRRPFFLPYNKMNESSDSLLAQILLVVQEVQVSIENFDTRLEEAVDSIRILNERVDKVVNEGFPRGDISAHKT